MLIQKQYCTIIIPDYLHKEIQKFQIYLSIQTKSQWTFSETINLLLSFCLDDLFFNLKNERFELIRKHFEGKESLLEELASCTIRSAIFDENITE